MPVVLTRVILDRVTLDGSSVLDLSDTIDAGDGSTLGVLFIVHEAGSGESPKLSLEHSITNEEQGYVPFDTPMAVALDTAATTVFLAPQYLRWLRWRLSGTLNDPAVVTLVVLAKS